MQSLTLALGALVTIDVQCLLTQTLRLVTSAVLVNIQVGHPLRILAVLYVDFRDLSCLPTRLMVLTGLTSRLQAQPVPHEMLFMSPIVAWECLRLYLPAFLDGEHSNW